MHSLESIIMLNSQKNPDEYCLQTSGIMNIHPGRHRRVKADVLRLRVPCENLVPQGLQAVKGGR